eukprot:TRINITY_DN65425_c0_g1_i1.p1 TRINITY_DN65425_c0_g1~~TRINITY_DN65425_c0_g1_i1.p1  ORF type:complete len:200 (+),score=70.05 TRINITY_DN65425_c0_g1_i1:88-600(+)
MAGYQQQMLQWFQFVDKDRSGQLDFRELQGALKQAGINFSLMSTNMMLRLFDPDRSGQISFQEFCNLYAWIQTKQQAFQQHDRARKGSLTKQETYPALQQAGFQLDQHAFEAAYKAYDPDHNQVLSMTEFVGLCAYLQMCMNTFQAFDPQRTGSVTVPFNQFVYMCSQCK